MPFVHLNQVRCCTPGAATWQNKAINGSGDIRFENGASTNRPVIATVLQMGTHYQMTLNLELDEQQARRLQEIASRLNVSVSDLAKAAINDLLAKPDNDFERAAERVLKKNTELYKRLA